MFETVFETMFETMFETRMRSRVSGGNRYFDPLAAASILKVFSQNRPGLAFFLDGCDAVEDSKIHRDAMECSRGARIAGSIVRPAGPGCLYLAKLFSSVCPRPFFLGLSIRIPSRVRTYLRTRIRRASQVVMEPEWAASRRRCRVWARSVGATGS